MDLVINGRFLTQPVTGVQRVGIEFLRALDALIGDGEFPELRVEVVLPRSGPDVAALSLTNISTRRAGLCGGHVWEQVSLPCVVGGRTALHLGNIAPLWSLLFAARRTHVMVHDLSYKYFPAAYDWKFRLVYRALVPIVLRRAATVATVSESERAAILEAEPRATRPDRLYSAQNGVSRYDDGAPVPPRNLRHRRVIYVGSLTQRKNASGVIDAAIRLARDHAADVTIVGSTGPSFEAAGPDLLEDSTGHVHFAGQVDDPVALAEIYRGAAVLFFPSFYEASPLPPTEAMIYGCPVVASSIPSLEERCGDAAEYCDPQDVASIVDAVAYVLDTPERWSELARLGTERAKRFTWEAQVREVMARVLA